MNLRTTYVLFGVLAGVMFLIALGLFLEPASAKSGYLLPKAKKDLTADKVDRVEIARTRPQEETLVFERDAETGRWKMTQPGEYRADRFAVEGLIREVLEAQRDPKADKAPSLKSWGLEPPAAVVTISQGDQRASLNVGDLSPDGAVIYASSSEQPTDPAAVRKTGLGDVLKRPIEFRDRDLLTPASGDVLAVKLSDGKQTVALKKEDLRWRYVEPPYGDATTDSDATAASPDRPPSGVNALLTDLSNIKVEFKDEKDNDFVADDVPESKLGEYNLGPDQAVLRIEIERAEEKAKKSGDEGEAKRKSTPITLLVGVSKEDKGKYFARVVGEKGVVKVAVKEIEPLRKLLAQPDALRDRTLLRLDLSSPDAIDVKNSSGLLEFRRPDGTKPWTFYLGEAAVPTDEAAIQNLVKMLTAPGIVRGFPDPKTDLKTLGLDAPTVVASLWLDGIAKEEKKDDKDKKAGKPKLKSETPTVRLSFGTAENKLVAVKREQGGQTTLLKVPDYLFEALKNGPLAYTDKTLPPFSERGAVLDVTKVVIQRNGAVTELTRDTKASDATQAWKIAQPADLAGRTADVNKVTTILQTLNTLKADRLVAEAGKVDPEVLDRDYGLKTPAVKVIVTTTKDDKATPHEYQFGKDTPENNGVFARLDQGFIFVVPKTVLAPLGADLQDPTVLHFDVARVRGLKLTGWQNLTGSPFVLELTRKDADSAWTAKTPATFKFDAAKVRRFIDDLANLRAEKIVSQKITPKEREDDGLNPDKEALTVEVTLDGEKDPLRLTVGSLDGDKTGSWATGGRLGEALFTIKRDLFEPLDKVGPRSRPTYFAP